ncbi:hypothetical protein SG34_025705 [Thalassomonas viridans]|uniref:Uncharacterized protein n=2 Tax=Thalassomonas viridans TaxID=137584 RepID=A0AAE9Z7W9_9GAMM|nr:hypothetical protein SG34_025705 [Thalassomonas viridans]
MTDTTQDYSNVVFSLADINEACQRHITRYYPVGKQLTLGRVGTEVEQVKMHAFIDACLEWANQEAPEMVELYRLTP